MTNGFGKRLALLLSLLATLLFTTVIALANEWIQPPFKQFSGTQIMPLDKHLKKAKEGLPQEAQNELDQLAAQDTRDARLIQSGKPISKDDRVLGTGKYKLDYGNLPSFEKVLAKTTFYYKHPEHLAKNTRIVSAGRAGFESRDATLPVSGINVHYQTPFGMLTITMDYIEENEAVVMAEEKINRSVGDKKAMLVTYIGEPSNEIIRELSWINNNWYVLLSANGDFPEEELLKIAESLPEPKLK